MLGGGGGVVGSYSRSDNVQPRRIVQLRTMTRRQRLQFAGREQAAKDESGLRNGPRLWNAMLVWWLRLPSRKTCERESRGCLSAPLAPVAPVAGTRPRPPTTLHSLCRVHTTSTTTNSRRHGLARRRVAQAADEPHRAVH